MNTFGNKYKVSIFGESHGTHVGVTIDGVPPGIELNNNDFLPDLLRRKSGAKGTTTRIESDEPKIISGVYNEFTQASPITILFDNNNQQSSDYNNTLETPRPGQADFVAHKKYKGYADRRGGGRFSGRLTLGIVAAGVIAKKIISPIEITATLIEVNGKSNINQEIDKAININESVGGIIECIVKNVPVGLGEPFFYSIESAVSAMMFSIPGIKAIEFGAGFEASKMYGSNYNDEIINKKGLTKTNNAGGINGGISNGNDIVFRVAVRPTGSILKPQKTINLETGKQEIITLKGRHDACIALRMPVIVEAGVACVLADMLLSK